MSKTRKNQISKIWLFLAGVSPLLISSLIAPPLLAQDICQDSIVKSNMGCLKSGLKEAIAQSKQTKKPVLTEQNLNAIIPQNPQDPNFRQVTTQAADDLRTFIRNRFTLTPEQERKLDSIPSEDLARIKTALNNAVEQGNPVTVKFVQRSDSTSAQGARLNIVESQESGLSTQARIKIKIEVEC